MWIMLNEITQWIQISSAASLHILNKITQSAADLSPVHFAAAETLGISFYMARLADESEERLTGKKQAEEKNGN